MTEKEKAKAYDEALERAKKLHDKIDIEEIFPESKESDDVKIKTAILNHFKKMWGNCQDDVCGVHVEDAIDWIEKQGEQAKNDTFFTEEEKQKLFDGIFKLFDDIKENGCKLNNEMNNETKTLKKLVKPKFKVGDKIFNKPRKYMGASGTQGTILKITEDGYYIFTDGSYVSIYNQDSWELLTDKKQKFDPKTMKPFDKVLVKRYDGVWVANFLSHYDEIIHTDDTNITYLEFTTISNGTYRHCIPYNNETKHILGTTEEAPEYYRYFDE